MGQVRQAGQVGKTRTRLAVIVAVAATLVLSHIALAQTAIKLATVVPQASVWDKNLKEAIGVACNFAKAGMVLVARNMLDYVQQVRKKHKWVYVAVVATVDGISAAVDPTFVGTAKVSGWVAALMGGHEADSGDPPPIST